jgi:EmrB/QacA subfamily drug resistance transporter
VPYDSAQAPNRLLIFIAALASVFVTAIESTIVATAMPTIVGELGDFALLSWVFTAYLLTQVVTVPIYGRLSDLYGRKPILLIGIVLFLAGSILCGFAWSMSSLVVFRVVQGLGAGALMPVGRTLIGDIYHGAERARMQGYVSSVFVAAALLGPVVGGFLATHTIWPLVFWVNVPLAILAGGILLWGLHEHIERRQHRIDWGGAALLGLGSGGLMFALAEVSSLGPAKAAAIGLAAVLVLTAFAFYERTVPEPIWPPSLWRDRMASCGNLVSVSIGCAMMGIAAYLPVYMQGVMGTTAIVSGTTIMAMSATSPIGAVFAGRIMLRTSYRTSAVCGGAMFILGTVMMTMLTPTSAVTWAMASGLCMGLGIGLSNNTYMVAVQTESGWAQRGVATSAFIFSRILGQSIGTAAFGGILNAGLSHYLGTSGDPVPKLLSPELRRTLAPDVLSNLVQALDGAVHTVFWILVGFSVIVMATGLLLRRGHGLR